MQNKSTQRAQTPPRPLHCYHVVTEYVSYKMPYLIRPLQHRPLVSDCTNLYLLRKLKKLMLHQQPNPDQHQQVVKVI